MKKTKGTQFPPARAFGPKNNGFSPNSEFQNFDTQYFTAGFNACITHNTPPFISSNRDNIEHSCTDWTYGFDDTSKASESQPDKKFACFFEEMDISTFFTITESAIMVYWILYPEDNFYLKNWIEKAVAKQELKIIIPVVAAGSLWITIEITRATNPYTEKQQWHVGENHNPYSSVAYNEEQLAGIAVITKEQ